MQIRTRFAPSPTGHVHIGNIRAAIFNWLYARHHGGQFLLRVEDTDRERSTPEAVQTVLNAMDWLGLTADEEPYFQFSHQADHLAAAGKLLDTGHAYRKARAEGEPEAVLFRIPWDLDGVPGARTAGPVEVRLHPDVPVTIHSGGISFASVSKKGKAVPQENMCLAGFRDLVLRDAEGATLLELNPVISEVFEGKTFEIEAASMAYTRREISFTDLVKGEQAKPLDSIKDLVIVRSDGTPVFHLANVCDDAAQGITHIIRGDDHVENTFRHVLLYHALGLPVPHYAHLPMIVNAQGKPYSKRDGDAYVGDFRAQGLFADVLFNYLTLLGWNPGDDTEIMDREELIRRFDLDRVQSSAAQMDPAKLLWMNGEYLRRLPMEELEALCLDKLQEAGLCADEAYARKVIGLMQERLRTPGDIVTQAGYFFSDSYEYNEKAVRKRLLREGALERLGQLRERYAALETFTEGSTEAALRDLSEETECGTGDFIHPVRVAVSGMPGGPGLFEMLAVLDKERVVSRIDRTIERFSGETA